MFEGYVVGTRELKTGMDKPIFGAQHYPLIPKPFGICTINAKWGANVCVLCFGGTMIRIAIPEFALSA